MNFWIQKGLCFLLICWIGSVRASDWSPFPKLCGELTRQLKGPSSRSNNQRHEVHGVTVPLGPLESPTVKDYIISSPIIPGAIKNQCRFGSCWAASTLQMIEAVGQAGGIEADLSLDYLIGTNLLAVAETQFLSAQYEAESLLKKISNENLQVENDDWLQNIDNDFHRWTASLKQFEESFVGEGQNLKRPIDTIRRFGVVPTKAWTPLRRFGVRRDDDQRLLLQIRRLQRNAYQELKDFVSELAQLKIQQSQGLLDAAQFERLKELFALDQTSDIRDSGVLLHRLREFGSLEGSPIVTRIADRLRSQVWTLVTLFVGVPPTRFVFEDQDLTAQEFFDLLVKPNYLLEEMFNDPAQVKTPPSMANFRGIKRAIENQLPLTVSLKWPAWVAQSQSGVVAIERFLIGEEDSEDFFEELYHPSVENHAVVIRGYLVDSEGRPQWLLIQNSWGPNVGEFGYYHLSFKSFQILFRSILMPKSLAEVWKSGAD